MMPQTLPYYIMGCRIIIINSGLGEGAGDKADNYFSFEPLF